MKLASKQDLGRAARTPGGVAGLLLLLIGLLSVIPAGLSLGMLIDGHPSHQSTVELHLAIEFGAAVVIGVFGNYLWYRARIATRRPPS